MPRGPKGEKRPADVIGAAVMVGRIATGEIEEPRGKAPKRARGGLRGGKARAAALQIATPLPSLDGRRAKRRLPDLPR